MEDNFRLTLIIISAVVIVALFAHGFWTLRKNKNPYKLKPEKNIVEGSMYDESYDGAGFDLTGVSKPRVVGSNPLNENEIPTTPAPAPDYDAEPIPKDYEKSTTDSYTDFVDDKAVEKVEPESFAGSSSANADGSSNEDGSEFLPEPVVEKSVYDEPVTQAKPHSITSKTIRESLKPKKPIKTKAELKRDQLEINFGDVPDVAPAVADEIPSMSALDEPVYKETVYKEPVTAKPAVQEPILQETAQAPTAPSAKVEAPVEPPKEKLLAVEPEVIILSVVMPEGESMSGAMLLPSLLTLGLRFGDMDIFHRHEDNAGHGKVTFSLANIMNPGTFNLDEIETFSTQGVSLFMTLPNAGDSFEVFEKMLNCAKQLALEFKGQVLDDKRSVMTKQTEQHYMSRIRDFTRKHRIATL